MAFSPSGIVPFVPPSIKCWKIDHRSVRKLTRLDTKPLKDIAPTVLTVFLPRTRSSEETKTPYLDLIASELSSSRVSPPIFSSGTRPWPIVPDTIATCVPPLTIPVTGPSTTTSSVMKIRLRARPKRKAILVTTLIKVRRNAPRK